MEAAKKKELANVLMGAKYCWDKDGKFLADEFYGLNYEMGFLDHMEAMIDETEKKAFKAGFLSGVKVLVEEDDSYKDARLAVDEGINQITAERKYLEWRE
jgi:hypothetical protein